MQNNLSSHLTVQMSKSERPIFLFLSLPISVNSFIFIFLSVCLSFFLSGYLSICLFIFLSVCLSFSLSSYISFYLFLFHAFLSLDLNVFVNTILQPFLLFFSMNLHQEVFYLIVNQLSIVITK